MRRRAALALSLALSVAAACGGGKEEVIVKTGGSGPDAAAIDRDPLALLPSRALGVTVIDCEQLYASPFGKDILALIRSRVPLPPSAGFEPQRDLKHLYVGTYTMSGLDTVGVAVGSFDRDKIAAAANGTEKSPIGFAVVKSRYAERDVVTSGNVGFVVLTERTALFGNETGIRRALDRLQEGRVVRAVPAWMDQLLATQKAPIISGFALKDNTLSNAVRRELPFLGEAETVRVLGNFAEPGLNFAGAITYADAKHAEAGAGQLRQRYSELATITAFTQWFGLDNPIKTFEARAEDRQASFVAGIDGPGVVRLLGLVAQLTGMQGTPTTIQATESKPVGAPK
jgi:hypothetical protein